MARCSECEAELSKETCSQNQWKRAKKEKAASCLQCLPVPSAEAREAKKHAEVQAFYRATSGGAQDGVERCKNGRKRKAAAPTARMRERGAEVFEEVERCYDLSTFNYNAEAARQQEELRARIEQSGDACSATALSLGVKLRELQHSLAQCATLSWIKPEAARSIGGDQRWDFLTTVRGGPHGKRERVEQRSSSNSNEHRPMGHMQCAKHATDTRELQLVCKQQGAQFHRTLLDESLVRRDVKGTVLCREDGTLVFVRIPDAHSLNAAACAAFRQEVNHMRRVRPTLVRGVNCASVSQDFFGMGLRVDPNCYAVTTHSALPELEYETAQVYLRLAALYRAHLRPLVRRFATVWFADLWAWIERHNIQCMVDQV